MPVTSATSAPYAPTSAILDIVNRYRSKGLPTPITSEVLARAGISDSLIPRTLQALTTLDLIDEIGNPTPTMEGLRKATEPDFQGKLLEWLRSAYADVLTYVDPETEGDIAIRDAFRHYNPVGQQSRMVSLFMGLFSAAGVGSDRPRAKRAPSPKAKIDKAPRVDKNKTGNENNIPDHNDSKPSPKPAGVTNGFIEALIKVLPSDAGDGKKPLFSSDERAKWLKAAVTVFDLIYEGDGGDIDVTIKGK